MNNSLDTFPIHGLVKYSECKCEICKKRADWLVNFEGELREKLTKWDLNKVLIQEMKEVKMEFPNFSKIQLLRQARINLEGTTVYECFTLLSKILGDILTLESKIIEFIGVDWAKNEDYNSL